MRLVSVLTTKSKAWALPRGARVARVASDVAARSLRGEEYVRESSIS
jgi:hypothetical protein